MEDSEGGKENGEEEVEDERNLEDAMETKRVINEEEK